MTHEVSNQGLVDQFKADRLNVYVYADRPSLGLAAAQFIGDELRRLLKQKERVAAIFASAPSQNETLAALAQEPEIDWQRIIGFHLDEYLGMEQSAPQSFRRFLLERLINKVPMGEFHGLPGEAHDAAWSCALYAEKLKQSAPDLALLGIGENGHLAFIDPPFCDFNDPATVKIVELDEPCRQQQVNEGAFTSLTVVPRQALSLTIPTIMACPKLVAIVPGPAKKQAIRKTIEGPIETSCPASILRRHTDAHLFLDRDSAALLSRNVSFNDSRIESNKEFTAETQRTPR